MREWRYHNPTFECDQLNEILMKYSPWVGHRYFVYDFIEYVKPKTIIELGSYYGCSTYAILQAIKDFALDSTMYAIDTWGGDIFTSHDYEEDIYGEFSKIHEQVFSELKLVKLRMTFDEAVKSFHDKSIDLLHIDGSHTYEEVKHDYETWKSKVSDDGVILFHDISEDKLYGETMGSCLFWKELSKEYDCTLEFDFSYGLGVVFKNKHMYESMKEIIHIPHYQRINNEMAINCNGKVREMWFELNSKQEYIADLLKQIEIRDVHLKRYQQDSKEKQNYIDELLNQIEKMKKDFETNSAAIDSLMRDKAVVDQYAKQCEEELARYKKSMEAIQSDKRIADEYIRQCEDVIAQKNKYIAELEEYKSSHSIEKQQEDDNSNVIQDIEENS